MMLKIALRGIRSHFVRFLLSVLAVLLGVSFVAGTFSLRSMLSATFDDIIEAGTLADAYVRGGERAGADDGSAMSGSGASPTEGTRTPVPLDLVDTVAEVDGVERAIPAVSGPVVVVGADGTAVLSGGAPSFALALYPDDPALTVVEGRAPAGPEEIALESATLEASGLDVGDRTRAIVGAELREVTVVGDVAFGAAAAGASIVLLDPGTAIAAYAPEGLVGQIEVHGEPGLSEAEVADRVESAVGAPDVTVATGETVREESRDAVGDILGFIETFLLVFAVISLFVGAFIISNTFTMAVRQRQREFALLRAVGTSPGQVFASILGQAVVVGLIGSALGVGAGVGLVAVLREVLARMGMELSGRIPLDVSTVVISMSVGVVVSVLAAALPARRAALTPPVEAMREDVNAADRSMTVRAAIGAVLVAGGVAAVIAATTVEQDGGTLLGIGAAGVVLGVLALSPVLVTWVLGAVARPLVATTKPLGALARGNVTRNPRRTASTAGALMIGMALVGAATVIAASAQESTRAIVTNESVSDLIIQSATGSVPAQVREQLAALDSVDRSDALTAGPVVVEGEQQLVAGFPTDGFGQTYAFEVVDGSIESLADGEMAVQRLVADDEGLGVGDTLTLTTAEGERDVRIGAVVDSRAVSTSYFASESTLEELVPVAGERLVFAVFVTAADGVALTDLRDDVTGVVSPYVVLTAMDNEEFASSLADQVNQVLVILYALLGLSIVIAVLGIVNTLALSLIERTREVGLLRAVGLGRTQLAGTVTIESVLIALFGTVLGLVVGVGLGATLPSVFEDQGLTDLAVPWGALLWMLALAVVVGVLAALWPAVRAARMPVLEAISYE